MAYIEAGLVKIAFGGALSTGGGSVRSLYHYITNDADTVVETDGYFDGITNDPLLVGDIIFASLDIDGTAEFKAYIVSVGGSDVTVVPFLIA